MGPWAVLIARLCNLRRQRPVRNPGTAGVWTSPSAHAMHLWASQMSVDPKQAVHPLGQAKQLLPWRGGVQTGTMRESQVCSRAA
jgi:hypothetical protein